MRVLSIGSVPPEWGGSTMGGVAVAHRVLLEQLAGRAGEVGLVGVVAPNRGPGSPAGEGGMTFLDPPAAASEQADWYVRVLDAHAVEVVHFHHIAHRWARWHVARAPGVPCLGTIQSWPAVTRKEGEERARALSLLRALAPSFTGLTFCSDHCAAEGRALGIDYPRHVRTIPNPVGHLLAGARLPAERRPGPPRVVFVGNLIPRKRAHLVIGAAARLEVEVSVVGEGTERRALRALADDLGLGRRVRLLGQVSHAELSPVLAEADAMCAPSESEPFGNVYVEALAAGVPVVGFGPSLREIAGRMGMAVGAPVEASGDVGDVAAALRLVLGRRWDRARLASAARRWCSPSGIADEYVGAYRSVAA